jgi:hypothetical protein
VTWRRYPRPPTRCGSIFGRCSRVRREVRAQLAQRHAPNSPTTTGPSPRLERNRRVDGKSRLVVSFLTMRQSS